jgi:hypothetical protein
MFRAEYEAYTDMEGREKAYVIKGGYVETVEKAVAMVNTEDNYRVIKVTMDEATFTVTEEIVVTHHKNNEKAIIIANCERAIAIRRGFDNKCAVEELCQKCGYARRFG